MKKYETPELELIRFQTEDVALNSSLFSEDPNPNAGGNIEEP